MIRIIRVLKKFVLVSFLALLFASFALFPLFVPKVFAQVVINEVFPNPSGSSSEPNEFVELLNIGSEVVIITAWQLADTQGSTKTYIFPEATITPGTYVNFRREVTGIALNNDGDGVELKDANGNLIDSFNFSQTVEDKSWSRIPNGTGSFVNNTDSTELLANSAPPTPDPTLIPTLTPTPTPTKTPTPNPTKTASPSPVKTSTPVPTRTTSPKPIDTPSAQTSTESGNVLSATDINTEQLSSPSNTPTPISKNTNSIFAYILIVLGFMLIGGSSYLAFKTTKSSDIKNDI